MTTISVLVGIATEPMGPLPLIISTLGVPVLAKKPTGYVSVMVLLVASAPPAVVVNENVAATAVLPATRWVVEIDNEVLVTCPPITPDATPADAVGSALVATVMPFELPAVAAPMVRPVTVTVTAVLAAIA